VVLALVVEKLVVVALVVVELVAVKFWKVEEAVTKRLVVVAWVAVRFKRVVMPEETESEPVKEAALEIVWLLIRPEVMVLAPRFKAPLLVMAPTAREVRLPVPPKRLVAKKLVVVALVPVALTKVKFCRVVEPRAKKLVEVASVAVRLAMVPKEVRDEAVTPAAKVVPVSEPAGAEPVILPVTLPVKLPVRLPVPEVKKRLVVEALVAKKEVVVALVVVELVAVKVWRVVEPELNWLP
jgi:hypothetical protein